MKNILLPTDFSPNAFRAIVYAMKLLEGTPFRLHLFHAYSMPSSVGVLISIGEILEEEAKEKLANEERRIKEHLGYPPVHFEKITMAGSFHELLSEIIKVYSIDLVVMGTKGARGLADTLLGTHTTRVIADTKCPLLVIPTDASFDQMKSVVFAADTQVDQKKLNGQWSLVDWLLTHYQPTFTKLHIANPDELDQGKPKATRSKIVKALPAVVACHEEKDVAYHEDVVEGIAGYVIKSAADIVVLVAHQHGWLGRAFHQSVSQQLAMRNIVPLLILHD